MHVIADRLEIAAAAAIDNERLVAAAKEVAKLLVPAVEATGVGPQQPFHADNQIRLRRLNHQVKVIGHQAEAMYLPAGLVTALTQRLQKPLPVLIILEDSLTAVATVHDVIDGTRIFHSQLARHCQNDP